MEGNATKAGNEYGTGADQRRRLAGMTLGERLDHNINVMQGEIERMTVIRKRLGSAADLKCEDVSSALYKMNLTDPF
jgi:hypothetical protein